MGSPGWTRTSNNSVNSRVLCQLSYRGSMASASLPEHLDRLLQRVSAKTIVDPVTACWRWTGSLNNRGYSQISVDGRVRSGHRVMYELLASPIPAGLQLDHLCRVRECINPAHLESVTGTENQHRAGHGLELFCKYGHPLFGDNLYVKPRGSGRKPVRTCRACSSRRQREKRAAERVKTGGAA